MPYSIAHLIDYNVEKRAAPLDRWSTADTAITQRWFLLQSCHVRDIHEAVLRPDDAPGENGATAVEEVCAQTYARLHHGDIGRDLLEIATAYAAAVLRSRPFVDGNKRTAIIAADAFLMLNELELVGLDRQDASLTRLLGRTMDSKNDERVLCRRLKPHVRSIYSSGGLDDRMRSGEVVSLEHWPFRHSPTLRRSFIVPNPQESTAKPVLPGRL